MKWKLNRQTVGNITFLPIHYSLHSWRVDGVVDCILYASSFEFCTFTVIEKALLMMPVVVEIALSCENDMGFNFGFC